MSEKSFDVAHVVQEVRIEAGPEKVWEALTAQTSGWWQKDFYTGPNPRGFVIEPRLGGRVFEDWGDGQGFLWFFVTGVRKHELLQLAGDSDERWGGPARHLTRFELKTDGEATVVRLVESVFGWMDKEKTQSDLEGGWKFLLGECLKPFVEAGRHPDRPATVSA